MQDQKIESQNPPSHAPIVSSWQTQPEEMLNKVTVDFEKVLQGVTYTSYYYGTHFTEQETWVSLFGFEPPFAEPNSIGLEKFQDIKKAQHKIAFLIHYFGHFQFPSEEKRNVRIKKTNPKTVDAYDSNDISSYYTYDVLSPYVLTDLEKSCRQPIYFLAQYSVLIFQTQAIQNALWNQISTVSLIKSRTNLYMASSEHYRDLLDVLVAKLHPWLIYNNTPSHLIREDEAWRISGYQARERLDKRMQEFFADRQPEEIEGVGQVCMSTVYKNFQDFLQHWFPASITPEQVAARDFWLEYLTKALKHFEKEKNTPVVASIKGCLAFTYYSLFQNNSPKSKYGDEDSKQDEERVLEKDLPTQEESLKQGLNYWLEANAFKNSGVLNIWVEKAWEEGMKEISDRTVLTKSPLLSCKPSIDYADEILKSKLRAQVLTVSYLHLVNNPVSGIESKNASAENKEEILRNRCSNIFLKEVSIETKDTTINKDDVFKNFFVVDQENINKTLYLALYKESLIRLDLTLQKRKTETRCSFLAIFSGYSKEDYLLRKNIYDGLLALHNGSSLESLQAIQNFVTEKLNSGELTKGWRKEFHAALSEVAQSLDLLLPKKPLNTQASTPALDIKSV